MPFHGAPLTVSRLGAVDRTGTGVDVTADATNSIAVADGVGACVVGLGDLGKEALEDERDTEEQREPTTQDWKPRKSEKKRSILRFALAVHLGSLRVD